MPQPRRRSSRSRPSSCFPPCCCPACARATPPSTLLRASVDHAPTRTERSVDDVRNFAKLLRPGRPTVVSAAAPCGTGWSSPAHASVVSFGVLVVASTLSTLADRFTPPGMAGRRGLAVHTTVACTRRRMFVHMLRNPVACCMLQCVMLQCCMLHGVCCMLQGVCCQRHGRVTATHAARCMLCCMPRVACRTMHAACRASLHLCRSAAWTSL